MLNLDKSLVRATTINTGRFRPQGGIEDDGDATHCQLSVVSCQLNAFHVAVETVSTQTRSASEAAMSVASP
jgi:hypothetical protein